MGVADIWRGKTDEQVLAAHRALQDYTEEGREYVRAELERRGLTPAEPLPDADETTVVSGNPIKRLWDGDYPLPQTYWGWGWLGSLLLAGAATVLTPLFAHVTGPAGTIVGAIGALGVLVALVGYYVLVAVGIWRSASKYRGNPTWATLARVAVAAGVTISVIRFIAIFFVNG